MPLTGRHLRPVPGSGSDADRLLAAVALGDREAYAELFDLLAPTVLGVCRRVIRDPAQAEEVTQEVMLEIWRSAPTHRPDRGSARTWAAMMAHRRAVDRVRCEQSERDRRQNHGGPSMPAPTDPVADAVADRSERDRVVAALSALTSVQRQSVELAYYGGHTHTEVATLLDLPVGTVKTRIRDGLIRLRDALGEQR